MKNVRIVAEWTRQGDKISCKVYEIESSGANTKLLQHDYIDIDPVIDEKMDKAAAKQVAIEYYKEYEIKSFRID